MTKNCFILLLKLLFLKEQNFDTVYCRHSLHILFSIVLSLFNKIRIQKKVGEGHFSEVFVSELKVCNQHGRKSKLRVAAKRSKSSETIEADKKEASFLALCSHPYVVEILGITQIDKDHVAIIMPCYEFSLSDYVNSEHNTITIHRALQWMYQTSSAYAYLIQKNGKMTQHFLNFSLFRMALTFIYLKLSWKKFTVLLSNSLASINTTFSKKIIQSLNFHI